jgi:hypothetical protein
MSGQPKRRLRIAHVVVQPVLVWDDGENLAPGPQTAGTAIGLAGLADLPDQLRAEVAALEASASGADDGQD